MGGKLKRPERIEELPSFLREFFKKKGLKVRVILFGSRARGTNSEHSDVDIALECERDLRTELAELKELLEESLLPQKVDIVELRKVPEQFKEEIEREGVVWVDLKN